MQYGTPHIPRDLYTAGAVVVDSRPLAQMLAFENRQRAARQQAEDKELDKVTQSSLGGVFAPDKAEAVKKYQTWHDNRTKVLHDKKLRRDRLGFAEAQTKEKEAFRDFMDFAAKSKLDAERYKGLQGMKPDERDDNFGMRMKAFGSSPMEQRKAYKENGQDIDLNNDDSFRYMGLDYDATKLNESARGKEVESEMDGAPSAPDSMMKKVNIYARRENNPAQMESIYFNAASEQKGKKYLRAQAAMLTPEVMNQIDEAIANVPEDVWKVMGGKADLSVKHPELPESVAANYLAKKTFLENLPRMKGTKDIVDLDKKRKFDEEHDFKLAKQKHKWDTDEIYLRQSLETANDKEAGDKIEGYMQNVEAAAKEANVKKKFTHTDKTKDDGKEYLAVAIPPAFQKAFRKQDINGATIEPNELWIDDKGRFVPIFWKKEIKKNKDGTLYETGEYAKDKDGHIVDFEKSVPVERFATKTQVAEALLTPTMTEASMPAPAGSKPKSDAPTKTKKIETLRLKYKYKP